MKSLLYVAIRCMHMHVRAWAMSKLHYRLRRLAYYWPKMFEDANKFANKCHKYQVHADFIHQPHEPLHATNISWPFEMWGMDIVGPINPPSSKGHKFILAATDYFSKWAELTPLKEDKAENVEHFIRAHSYIVSAFLVGLCLITEPLLKINK